MRNKYKTKKTICLNLNLDYADFADYADWLSVIPDGSCPRSGRGQAIRGNDKFLKHRSTK